MNPTTIFLVENSEPIRQRLKSELALIPDVHLAGWSEDESRAIEHIKRYKPDVVICSLQLSSGNGMSVLSNVRKADPDVIFIMLTHYPYTQYKERCKDHGANYFFDKATEFMIVPEVIKFIQFHKAYKGNLAPYPLQGSYA